MNELLLKRALEALPHAYTPYSRFHVAAALLCEDGSILTGVNVENSAFGATVCAERSAFCTAISAGKRRFVKILIIGGKEGKITDFCPPCGTCRQVMRELCEDDFEIVLFDGKDWQSYRLKELLPAGFTL